MANVCGQVLSDELESLTWINRVMLFFMPFVTAWVAWKKEMQFTKTGKRLLKINFFLFDGIFFWARSVRLNAGNAHALNQIYNFWPSRKWFHFLSPVTLFDACWASVLNCKAVRNRYRLTKSFLASAIELKGGNVRVLELAAGTSQALLETVALFKSRGVIVYATLVDIDPSSLEKARLLARELGVECQIETVVQNLISYLRSNRNVRTFDIVEMVGIADYLDERKVSFVYEMSCKILSPGGRLITSNISDNPERQFTHVVVDWPDMHYRELPEMDSCLRLAGFPAPNVFKEPTFLYTIGVGVKQ